MPAAAAGRAADRTGAEHAEEVLRFAAAVADDLSLLASLHDREPTRDIIEAARRAPMSEQLGIALQSARGRDALAAFARMIEALPSRIDDEVVDDLAAGFTEVYLRHSYRAAPTESVWMTEDGLERQAPMFQVRDWYRRANLRVTDWASRPDDHLVLQVLFVAHVMKNARGADDMRQAARFLDEHLLRWVHRFAQRLIQAEAPDWYAALALLTACYVDEVRDHLTEITGQQRPRGDQVAGKERSVDGADVPYLPGVAPSW